MLDPDRLGYHKGKARAAYGSTTSLVVSAGMGPGTVCCRPEGQRTSSAAAAVIAAMTLAGVVSLAVLVERQSARAQTTFARGPGVIVRLDRSPPAIPLVDQHGARVSLADLRGRPSLLTVAFGHCATVCPAVVDDLRRARRSAGRPDVRLVVVTVDPWRDIPERLPSLATHWALGAGDRLLSGSVADVEQVLDSLGIGRRRNEKTGDIEHGTTVMLVSSQGRLEWRVDGG